MSSVRSFEIPPNQKGGVILASGGVNPGLAEAIADSLGIEAAGVEHSFHPNGELYERYKESVRGKDVFVVQSHATANGYRIEEALNEHLYLVSAAAGSSAHSVTAIAPYLAHSRGDRKSRGREAAPAPLVIQFFEAAGATAMMSIDVHSPQTIEHFRVGPYEHPTAQPELRHAVREYLGDEATKNCVIVAPDAGAMKNTNRHARELREELKEELGEEEVSGIRAIFIDKERMSDGSGDVARDQLVSGVEDKICLIFDDMIDGGSTMATAADMLKEAGAQGVYVGATHAIFSGRAVEKLMKSQIDRVFVADTLPVGDAKAEMGDKLQVVEIGHLIGRAIYEIVTGGSISKIFAEQNYG